MGSVIDFANRRQARRPGSGTPTPITGQHVRCAQCGERHPVVRFKAGESRCVSAFSDGTRWFCLHGGCRREWLAHNGEPTEP